jgi:predicted aspartyl protease
VTRLRLAVAAVIVVATLAPSPAAAEIYRYTDAKGNSHYVDGFESVPQEYRARAVPMGLQNAPPGAATAAPGPTTPGTTGRAGTPASGPKGGATIRYTPGRPIMVDAKVNGSTSASLLLDTGADKTMINPRVLTAAGVSLARPVGMTRVTGVAGSDNVSFVLIESLEIGDARVGRMQIASYDVSGAGDGLLGRDFLDRFTINIDSTNGIVTLSPK